MRDGIEERQISNDELWNLMPMRKSLNSNKNNKRPQWDDFFEPFARYQFYSAPNVPSYFFTAH